MMAALDERKKLGEAAERAACRFLRAAGYRILERNYRTRHGELDAIAFHDGELVFVEVRARSSERFGSGAESVDGRKQRRLVKMARLYLQKRGVEPRPCRFDVVEMKVLPGGKWEGKVIRDAFSAG